MIQSFRDKRTEQLFHDGQHKSVAKELAGKALVKLDVLHHAENLESLYFPPSNRLEALQGYNPTRYSIRINRQWRISFEWEEPHAYDVLFEDYH